MSNLEPPRSRRAARSLSSGSSDFTLPAGEPGPTSATDIYSGVVKIRGAFKQWTKRYCVLRPGWLFHYDDSSMDPKDSGKINIANCTVEFRDSKKTGYCFKLRNLDGKGIAPSARPLVNADNVILRVSTAAEREMWVANLRDAIDAAEHVGTRTKRFLYRGDPNTSLDDGGSARTRASRSPRGGADAFGDEPSDNGSARRREGRSSRRSGRERGGDRGGDDRDRRGGRKDGGTRSRRNGKSGGRDRFSDDSAGSGQSDGNSYTYAYTYESYSADGDDDGGAGGSDIAVGTTYENFGLLEIGDGNEEEEAIGDESQGLVSMLLKQVRPGMDLSRVVLPTFILEPRSFLEKLGDFFAHVDLLAEVPQIEDPMERMIALTKWYLSGFYIRPKGVKKPYNPILGETFRCQWRHNDSTTFFVAEQVSHHPPISAFYAHNRKLGLVINGTLRPKSKFMGYYVQALLDGHATVDILSRGERYKVTFPNTNGKGFLFGTLRAEMVGTVMVECEQTNLSAKIEFKNKGMFSGTDNSVAGTIKMGSTKAYELEGQWMDVITIKKKGEKTGKPLWSVDGKAQQRVPLWLPAYDEQGEFESRKLWEKVTEAIETNDQKGATEEKYVLEQAQRERREERKTTGAEWETKLFDLVESDPPFYEYNYGVHEELPPAMADDLVEFEADGRIYAVSSAEAARLVESGRVAGSIGGGGAGKARVRRTRRVRKRVRRGGRLTGRSRRRKRKVDKADSRPPAYDDVDGDVGGSNQAGPSGAGVGSAPVAVKAPVRPTRLGGAAASASAAGAAQDDTIAAIQREVKKLKVQQQKMSAQCTKLEKKLKGSKLLSLNTLFTLIIIIWGVWLSYRLWTLQHDA